MRQKGGMCRSVRRGMRNILGVCAHNFGIMCGALAMLCAKNEKRMYVHVCAGGYVQLPSLTSMPGNPIHNKCLKTTKITMSPKGQTDSGGSANMTRESSGSFQLWGQIQEIEGAGTNWRSGWAGGKRSIGPHLQSLLVVRSCLLKTFGVPLG